jgi:hypothetical protein
MHSGLPPAYLSEFGQQVQIGDGAQLGSGARAVRASPGVDSSIQERRLVHQRSIEAGLQDQTQQRSAGHVNDGWDNDGR